MRYHKHWHARPWGSYSHDRAKGDLSLSTRITDGPANTRGRNVDLQFTRQEVRQLLTSLSMWYPDEIMTAGAIIREADNLAENGGYNDLRYGREYGYLRSQMLNAALAALPSGMTVEEAWQRAKDVEEGRAPSGSVVFPLTGPGSVTDPRPAAESDDDDGFSEDGEFKQ